MSLDQDPPASVTFHGPRTIGAARMSDALAPVLLSVFGPVEDLPDDFRAMLVRIDKQAL